MKLAVNIMTPNTRNYPYWPPLGIQNSLLIPGQSMAGEIQDIPLNRIPGDWQGDYNTADLRTIPTPDSPKNDITESLKLDSHTVDMGRGASIGLIDLFLQTQKEVTDISGNR